MIASVTTTSPTAPPTRTVAAAICSGKKLVALYARYPPAATHINPAARIFTEAA